VRILALPHSLNILDYPARFQFGQVGAPCVGKSCCTDTCMQMIVEYYKEKTYTLASIRRLAEAKTNFNEDPCTGLNYIEALNALSALGLSHYKVAFGINAGFVANKTLIGPVLVGVHYGSYPNSVGGRCGTINKAEISGKTDCPFKGAHAILAIKRLEHVVNGVTHIDVLTRDPDHSSPARPEKPRFDKIKLAQLNLAIQNLPKLTAFTQTFCIYPTTKKTL